MLALDGRCKTLSPSADGYARADACGIMLMLPTESVAAGATDSVLAAVAGTAVNQDGRSSTLTAPNGPAQQEVLRAALASSRVLPADLAALQMHGTGTSLGDPIEVGALAAVLVDGQGRGPGAQPLALMAAKSWTGHAEPGAGAVGLQHVQAALGQTALLPVLHLGPVNPYVMGAMDMGGQPGAWVAPRQQGALVQVATGTAGASLGVSAFAFQGTNAHAVLQRAHDGGVAMAKPSVTWERQRFWVTPRQHSGEQVN